MLEELGRALPESPQVKSEKTGRVKQGENVKMGNPKREREMG